jgi:PAS domain S-box-containing protein
VDRARGRTIWVNPSVERMTGYTTRRVPALPGFPLSLIAPEGQGEAARRFRQALGGESGEGYQFRMLRKDGTRFWAAVNWHSIYSRENQFLGIRASIRDISELKASEDGPGISGWHRNRARAPESAAVGDESGHPVRRHRSPRDLSQPAFNQIWLLPEQVDLIGQHADTIFAASTCELANRKLRD